jgi:hypothetical protein
MGSHSGADDSITRSPTKALEKKSKEVKLPVLPHGASWRRRVNLFSEVDRKGEGQEGGLDLIGVVT